jgi:ABC-type dipeptide/oligopeptide/nickel transport system permease component
MVPYICRRLLQMFVVLVGVTFVMFVVRSPGIVPGDPIRMIVGERSVTPEVREAVTQKYGLDKPVRIQYYRYMKALVSGDLGESYQYRRPVRDILLERFPNTLKLIGLAFLIEAVLGVGAGMLAAVRKNSFWDVLVTVSTGVLVSMPVFWLGMLLQQLFAIKFREWGLWHLPATGMTGDGSSFWLHVILPALTLASVSTAYAARIARSQLLEVMGQDYMRTALAKGLSRAQALWGHGLKNAMLPVVTFLGLDLGTMVGGAILTESVFNWPGIGYTMYGAVAARDWPIVTGGVLIVVLAVMVISLIADVACALLDPRVRYGRAQR